MKGVVFTEFLEMTESRFGLEMVDRIVEKSNLPSGGAYTAVGTYDCSELLAMVSQLSAEVGVAVPDLIRQFARHLFQGLAAAYPHLLEGMTSSLDVLQNVEGFIHEEVKKLYPDAELPRIGFRQLDERRWELQYDSRRPFAGLCEGLIEACIRHFDDDLSVERTDFEVEEGASSRFVLAALHEAPQCAS